MRKLLLGIALFTLGHAALAQSVIKGKVADTLEKKPLQNAVVSILKRSDSTLRYFTRTTRSGEFRINNVDSGNYVLLITYPGFADYADYIKVNQGQTNIGSIPLTLKSKLLNAVIIKSAGAIRIKGDTTEFVADSFHVKEGATVEDLLKKFPGFTVNSKGEITAQGKRVDKVLVDGEEFFGDDPTMVTQNLSSKTVDKVQVFDTKTDQQNLTGLSSGESNTKTLNIKLKDEFKKGSFGRVEAASDFDRYHDGKILYNHFKKQEKLSLYGTKSNTSAGGLSWQDQNKFGLDNNDYEYDEIGGFFYSFSQGDDFSDWNLRGLPNAYTAGGVYINKWNQNKQTLNGSYKYNYLGTTNQSSTFTKSILPDSVLLGQKSTNGHSLLQQSAPSLKYEWKIDSLNTLTLKSNYSYKTNKTTGHTYSETELEDGTPVNNSSRGNNNNGTKTRNDNLLTYKKLFKKVNRQFTASFRYTYAGNDEDNFINTHYQYFTNGLLSSNDSLDQEKIVHSKSSTMGASLSWTEPLSKKWSLVALANYSQNNSNAHLNTFDKSINGKYETFSPLYSNNFTYEAQAAGGTLVAKYTTKKINFAGGTGISNIKQDIHNLNNNVSSHYLFLKVLPQFQFRYIIKPQTGFYFSYRGNSQQPTVEQLQPLRNNNDPLNVYIGNPNLKVGFNNNFNLSYNSFKTLSQRYFYIGTNYAAISNAVTTSSTVDSIRTSTNINTNGNHNWSVWSNWYKSQGQGKWSFSSYGNARGGTSITFVNSKRSSNKNASYEIHVNLNKSKDDKYEISFGPHFGQTFSSSSLQPDNKTHYITWGTDGYGALYFLKKFEINTTIDANFRQRINASDKNVNVFQWDMQLKRKLFKKDVAKISIIAHDILNQNKGVSRFVNSNFMTDERYLQVSRYFQLKFEWSFNNNPASK